MTATSQRTPPAVGTRAAGSPSPVVVGAAAVAAAVVALVVGLVVGSALVAAPAGLPDAGDAVRWTLPIARVVHDLAAAVTVGLLVLAAVALPGGGTVLTGPALRAARAALWTGLVWVAAIAVVTVVTYADVAGVSVRAPGFADQLTGFLREVDLGRAWVLVAVLATAATVAAATATGAGGAAAGALLALAALLPIATTGHSASAESHETAVTALGLHLVSVAVWAGGLAALLGGWRAMTSAERTTVAGRFSTIAGWGYAGVAVSGTALAVVALGDLAGVFTGYGALVAGKLVLLVLLGLGGWQHRRALLPALGGAGGGAALARLAAVEVVLMGAAVGLGVALSRSAPPVPDQVGVPVVGALGYSLPPEPTPLRWLTEWRLDLLWALVAAVGVGFYLAGRRRLRARGVSWPVGRSLSWVLGMALLVYVTSGAPGAYGRVLFSAHMTAHMLLSMAVPLLLVMAAPMTLALRTLPVRHDGTRGPREWLLVLLHSRLLAVLAHPAVAGGIFAGSLVVFYWTGWVEWSLRSHTGHVLMTTHFLLAGYLFAWVLAGPDPGPRRPPYVLRIVVLFVVVSFHAFFGVAVMSGTTLIAPDWFAALQRPYRPDLLADQQVGGALAWGFGELPTLVLAMLVLVAWVRADDREAVRTDRQADRDGDAELTRYNAYLASLDRRPEA